jgi:hypothetical protein
MENSGSRDFLCFGWGYLNNTIALLFILWLSCFTSNQKEFGGKEPKQKGFRELISARIDAEYGQVTKYCE